METSQLNACTVLSEPSLLANKYSNLKEIEIHNIGNQINFNKAHKVLPEPSMFAYINR